MRRPLLVLSLAAIALLAAACAASSGPAWTYAPPTAAPASQAAPSAAPSAGASGGPGGTIQISALNIAFEQSDVSAPAGAAFVIHFNNKDASTQHNVEIKDGSGMTMFKGEIITGPKEIDYQVPALAAGTYKFICTVHPNMVGTLTVGG